jgi:pimeloyl-ACP methyl ester carboxylesterase
MSTANVARDLDLLRQAVGDAGLTYIGFSYGTHIGAVYANLFPDRVRAITLDPVIDPVDWTAGDNAREAQQPMSYRLGSHRGAADALATFLAACAADARCAFREEGADLRRKYDRMLARLRRQPAELGDADSGEAVTVTYQLAVSVTWNLLYDPAASTLLGEFLQLVHLATSPVSAQSRPRTLRRAEATLGEPLAELLERAGRAPAWTPFQVPEEEPYLGAEGRTTVLCTDSENPRNPWVWPRLARRADREGYPFGSPWVYLSLPCAFWPARDETAIPGPGTRRPPTRCCWWATASGIPPRRPSGPSGRLRSGSRTPGCSRWTPSATVPRCGAPA